MFVPFKTIKKLSTDIFLRYFECDRRLIVSYNMDGDVWVFSYQGIFSSPDVDDKTRCCTELRT